MTHGSNIDLILRAVPACIAIHYQQSQQGSASGSSSSNLFSWYTKPEFFYTICTLLRLIEIKNRRGTIPYNWKFTVSSDTPWFLTLALSGNFTLGRPCGGPDYSRNTALSLETSLETKTHEVHLIGPTGQRDIFTSNSVPVERIC